MITFFDSSFCEIQLLSRLMTISESIVHYCHYQERCHSEVRYKLVELGARGEELEGLLAQLVQDNLLNETRFAESYVRGKFRMNHWGRRKIIQSLKQKQVSEYCIRKGLQQIEGEEYYSVMEKLTTRKWEELKKERSPAVRKQKVLRYMLQKGFEYELIDEVIRSIN